MTTLDKHAEVPLALALQLEGAAIMANKTTAEYLEELLTTHTSRRSVKARTEKFRNFIREGLEGGLNDREIAEEWGVSSQAVARQRNIMGLPPQSRKGSRTNYEFRRQVTTLHGKGLSDREISEVLKKALSYVTRARREMGLDPNKEMDWAQELRREWVEFQLERTPQTINEEMC